MSEITITVDDQISVVYFAVAGFFFFVERKNRLKLTDSVFFFNRIFCTAQLLLIIPTAPPGSGYAVTTAHVCIFINEISWVKRTLMCVFFFFYGKICCKHHAQNVSKSLLATGLGQVVGNFQNPDSDVKMRDQKSAASKAHTDSRSGGGGGGGRNGWRRYRGPLRHHWEMLSDAEAVPQLNTVGESLSWKQGGKACLFMELHKNELRRSSLPPPLQTQSQDRKLDSNLQLCILQPHTKTGRVVQVHKRAVYLRRLITACYYRLGCAHAASALMMMRCYSFGCVPHIEKTGAGGCDQQHLEQ